MGDARLHHDEARIVGQDGRAAKHDDEPQTRPVHHIQRAALVTRQRELADRAGNRHARRDIDVASG